MDLKTCRKTEPDVPESAEQPTPPPRTATTDSAVPFESAQLERVHHQLDGELSWTSALNSGRGARAVHDLETLPPTTLAKMLTSLQATGEIEKLMNLVSRDDQALEAFAALLVDRDLLKRDSTPWQGGLYGVRPKDIYRPTEVELPTAVLAALDKRNIRVNADYRSELATWRKNVAAVPQSQTGPARESPADQPSLAGSPEEAARFREGTWPSLDAALHSPIDAVQRSAHFVVAQRDVIDRVRGLEIGSTEKISVEGASILVERKEQEKYEATLTLDAAKKLGVDLKEKAGAFGFKVNAQVQFGVGGTVRFQVKSPDELAQLVAAMKTITLLDGLPKDAAGRAAYDRAVSFVSAHLRSASLNQKAGEDFGLEGTASGLKVGGNGSILHTNEVELSRTDDGRVATTLRQKLKVSSSTYRTLDVDENITSVTVERKSIEAGHGLAAKEEAKVKVKLEDRRGTRIEERELIWSVPPAELDEWSDAIERGDKAKLDTLKAHVETELRKRGGYITTVDFWFGKVEQKHMVKHSEEKSCAN